MLYIRGYTTNIKYYQFILLIIVPAASMWTKKELDEFKESIRNEGGDSIIKVRSIDYDHISAIGNFLKT